MSSPESFKGSPPSSPEALEARIERHLAKLPMELRGQWERDFESAEEDQLPELEKQLRTLLARRNRSLRSSPPLFFDTEHLLSNKKAISETLKVVREAERRPDLFVGEGQVARVYRSPRNPGLCYKVVHDVARYEEWNSVDKEGHYLENLGDLTVEGVRVPHLISIIDKPDTKVIEMEYLNAVSIEKALRSDDPTVQDLDIGRFIERLRAYVSVMHETYNIYHRDLHEGNVLIGRSDGTPYVIDFGCATRAQDSETAYESLDKFGQKISRFMSDEDRISAAEQKLRTYQAQRSL